MRTAADGFTLEGTFHAAEKGGPAILLLHQCNADRHIYDQLATMLNTAGYNVLAFDFRGFGGSRAGAFTDFAAARATVIDRMPGDVDAALKFLTAQATVSGRALGVVGGSCGVNQAVQASRRHPEFVPSCCCRAARTPRVKRIKSSPNLSVFRAASDEDTDAAASIRKIVGLSANSYSRMAMFKGVGHAASMLPSSPTWKRTS